MQSKTSFFNNGSLRTSSQTGVAISPFNATVFKKNLTRFAPVWVVYTLMICTYLVMLYSSIAIGDDSGYGKLLGFADVFIGGMTSASMVVNIAYALLVAQLLFGDLYNSRMCNALHAMPLRREAWFATNCLSGMAFSGIPTFVGMLLLIPMLTVSIVENAWMLAVLWFVMINLQYLCCFGIAAFAAMCVGSRFTMAAGYGLIQFGAWIVYWLVATVYTPMLYGVITPTTLAANLTPSAHMVNYDLLQVEGMIYEYDLIERDISLADVTVYFTLTPHWWRLFAMAIVGAVFALLALALYRKRDLECAGDAVAFPILKPVFQVLCALFVMCAGQFLVSNILGMREFTIPIMAVCLVIGWFVAKMLIEHTTRVFRLKNWYGLAALAVCLAVSLAATHFDILNIEERLPDWEKIAAVRFETNTRQAYEMTEDKWDDVLRIHELAVSDRVEDTGLYIIEADGARVHYASEQGVIMTEDKTWPDVEDLLGYEEYVQAGNVRITYEMKNGSTMERRYNIWTDGEIGDLTRNVLSDWEILTFDKTEIDGEWVKTVDAAMTDFYRMNITGETYRDVLKEMDKADARSFLEAVKRDAQAGLMMQDNNFHRGVFLREEEDYYGETYFDTRENLWVSIESRIGAWDVRVYPDCVNTMNWLIDRGLIEYTVYPDAIVLPG